MNFPQQEELTYTPITRNIPSRYILDLIVTDSVLILAAAATIGPMTQLSGYYILHLPQWVVALVIAITLFSLFELAGKFFAPAGALAFNPMLVPQEALVWLPIQASAGAALFITVALVLFMRCYRWTQAQLVFCLTPAPVRKYLNRPGGNPDLQGCR